MDNEQRIKNLEQKLADALAALRVIAEGAQEVCLRPPSQYRELEYFETLRRIRDCAKEVIANSSIAVSNERGLNDKPEVEPSDEVLKSLDKVIASQGANNACICAIRDLGHPVKVEGGGMNPQYFESGQLAAKEQRIEAFILERKVIYSENDRSLVWPNTARNYSDDSYNKIALVRAPVRTADNMKDGVA